MKKKYIRDYVPKEDSSYEYRGKYYIYERSKEERRSSGKIQLFYGGSSFTMLCLALSIPGTGSETLYVVLPLEFMLICYLYHLIGSFGLFTVDSRMEQRFYDRVFERPVQALTIALILEFFSLSGQMIGVIFRNTATTWDYIIEGLLIFHFIVSFYFWDKQRKELNLVREENP